MVDIMTFQEWWGPRSSDRHRRRQPACLSTHL